MSSSCSQCGTELPQKSALCPACKVNDALPKAADASEFDHRRIQMPARTRVGGIIIPQ